MKKRFLSLVMALSMIFSLLPATAAAEDLDNIEPLEEPLTLISEATVKVRAQEEFCIFYATDSLTVSSDTAESYGYSDLVDRTTVSALDVLVAAHADYFGGSFTKETASEYLVMGSYGSTKAFGSGDGKFSGFAINHGYAMNSDGVGYLVNTAPVGDGDILDFFYYEDPYWGDTLSWFTDSDGNIVDSLTVKAGEPFALGLMGFMFSAGYANPDPEPVFEPDGGLMLCTVEGGWLAEIDSEDGFTYAFDEPGVYYLTAHGFTKDGWLIIPPYCVITVEAVPSPESLEIIMPEGYYQWATYGTTLRGFLVPVNDDRTFQFWVTAYPEGTSTQVTWSIDSTYATISEDGLLIVSDLGTSSRLVKVTATSAADPSVSVSTEYLTMLPNFGFYSKPSAITLPENNLSIKTASASFLSDYAGAIEWQIDDESIARINTVLADPVPNNITIQGLRPGTTTLHAVHKQNSGLVDSVTITVNGVSVESDNGNRLIITEDEQQPTLALTAYLAEGRTVESWTSSNETVATVDENGLVTAHGAGSAFITATDSAGISGALRIEVAQAMRPYFERLEFLASALSDWTAGVTFAPTTLDYPLTIKAYSTTQLTMQATTRYDTERYTAVASYMSVDGQPQAVAVNSGAITYLPGIPFDASTVTVTLTDKADNNNQTVYTFAVTRPRDTTSTIKATTGAVMVPQGRSLLPALYNGKAEGTFFRANEDGSLSATTGISATHYNYQTYALNGLEAFALTLTGTTNYLHMRYSVDGGAWKDIASGGTTANITFGSSETVTVTVQIISDKAYTENIKAGNSGFAMIGTDGKAYTIAITQIKSAVASAQMATASSDKGDWYPAFTPSQYTYNIIVPNGTTAGTLTYTLPEGAKAYVGTALQEPNAIGIYTLALGTSAKTVTVKNADESLSCAYSFTLRPKLKYDVPDGVADYLAINSQYTNAGSYGMYPELTLSGTMKSLGGYGGYITYYYEDAITNNPNNPYGVDFYIYGNAFASSGGYDSSGEPGQVWVSEDGETWYALAGSEHYEDTTLWDYTITYSRTDAGRIAWRDNYGNSNSGTSRTGSWPLAGNYPLNKLLSRNSLTLSGILLMSQDGTVTGNGTTGAYAATSDFGYVDAVGNSAVGAHANPYTGSRVTSGFDLAWAVDAEGTPVAFANGVHYIKVVTASNIYAGSFDEKSTEVQSLIRTEATEAPVGKTTAPAGVMLEDAASSITVDFVAGQQVYNVDVGQMSRVDISVLGVSASDNVYINNGRGTSATGFTVTMTEPRQVRIIVQNGEREPLIYLLNLTGSAPEVIVPITGIDVGIGGTIHAAQSTDGNTYTLQVGSWVDSIALLPRLAEGGVCTINDAAIQSTYALGVGANTFTINAVAGTATQTVTLVITRRAAPVEGSEITVTLTVLGDSHHAEGTVHAYSANPNGLETWLGATQYEAQAGDTVLSVIEAALRSAGIPYVLSGGNYISSIGGLAEMDNGPRSGWLYLINGRYPDLEIGKQTIKQGDHIILHYTDDYTLEQSGQDWTGPGTGTGSDSTGTATAPGEEVLAGETPLAELETMTFDDVAGDAWYAEAVAYVSSRGLMVGTGGRQFSPEPSMSRAMVVSVLYRMEGQPEAQADSAFADVASGQWYSDAIAWASESGIVNGYGDGLFGPGDSMTRQQIATVFYRYAQHKGYDLTADDDLSAYTDTHQISDWATTAMAWAVHQGLIQGTTETTLEPDGIATRAQGATLLMRFNEGVVTH